MRRLLAVTVLAAAFTVALNGRLFSSGESELNLASEIETDDESADDDKNSEEKELDKALHDILYQDEDHDLRARAVPANGNVTERCREALPDAAAVIGFSHHRHPCVAFCKYRKTTGRTLYGGAHVAMNTTELCSADSTEFVCADKKCVRKATSEADMGLCRRLVPEPIGNRSAYIVEPCRLLCEDSGAVSKTERFQYTARAEGASCEKDGHNGLCQGGRCLTL